MDNKVFRPEDRLRLNEDVGEDSPIPHMTCEQAKEMTSQFERRELSVGEILVLAMHLVSSEIEPDRPHTSECPSHDKALCDAVTNELRNAGE